MVITAARRYGARGLGVDIDHELVERSNREAARLGLADRVRFRVEDVTRTPLGEASVVTLYLLPGMTHLLRPRLFAELAPGARIVAHDFDLGEWKADREIAMDVKEKYGAPGSWRSTLYLWTVPAKIGGMWQIEAAGDPRRMLVRFEQHYQMLSGDAVQAGRSFAMSGARITGGSVQFHLASGGGDPALFYEGTVEGETMHGTVQRGDERQPWSAVRLTSTPAAQ